LGVTCFYAIAIRAVVARGVDGRMGTGLRRLATAIGGARDGIVTVHRSAHLAAHGRIAMLRAVTEGGVVARLILRNMRAGVAHAVAKIQGARDAVIAKRRRSRDAPEHEAARLDAIARDSVVAERVIRLVSAFLLGFVASVGGAGNAVVA
jgi:hypothetical protein